jgi:hypothetical protein
MKCGMRIAEFGMIGSEQSLTRGVRPAAGHARQLKEATRESRVAHYGRAKTSARLVGTPFWLSFPTRRV